MTEFRMPSLGADMEAGTLVEWLVKPGDSVAKGDIVAVVETEKGAIEVEIFDEGRIDRLLVPTGVKVPVGTPLAVLAKPGEEIPPGGIKPEKRETPSSPSPIAPSVGADTAIAEPRQGRPRISPAARRLAWEKGIDLAGVAGSGPGGAIISADINAVSAALRVAKKDRAKGLDLSEMRKAIAAAMTRSKRDIPHFYLQHTVDMSESLIWLERTNAQRDPPDRLLAAALFVKAVAGALGKYGEFNGHYGANGFERAEAVYAGFAVAIRGGGLIAPGIRDAQSLSLDNLMGKMKDLVARARTGRLRSSELSDPTITISSLGDRGVQSLFGIIYPPQVALVGFGKIETRPAVVEDKVEPRPQITITLSADHRVGDGHRGALFLAEIGKRLQQPEEL